MWGGKRSRKNFKELNARVTSGCLWIWLSFSYPPVCFPRLSVVLFFFSQAFFPPISGGYIPIISLLTNLWIGYKKQNFEIHLTYFSMLPDTYVDEESIFFLVVKFPIHISLFTITLFLDTLWTHILYPEVFLSQKVFPLT